MGGVVGAGGLAGGTQARGRDVSAADEIDQGRDPRQVRAGEDLSERDPLLPFRAMSSGDAAVTIRQSPGGPSSLTLLRQGVTEILSRRRLIRYLVQADMKKRGSDTVLGNLWWILDPLLQLVVYVIFVTIISRNGRHPDYPLFIFAAILPWKWFSPVITDATSSVVRAGEADPPDRVPEARPAASRRDRRRRRASPGASSRSVALLLLHPDARSASCSSGSRSSPPSSSCSPSPSPSSSPPANVFFRDLGNALGHVLRLWWFLSPGLYSLDTLARARLPQGPPDRRRRCSS